MTVVPSMVDLAGDALRPPDGLGVLAEERLLDPVAHDAAVGHHPGALDARRPARRSVVSSPSAARRGGRTSSRLSRSGGSSLMKLM